MNKTNELFIEFNFLSWYIWLLKANARLNSNKSCRILTVHKNIVSAQNRMTHESHAHTQHHHYDVCVLDFHCIALCRVILTFQCIREAFQRKFCCVKIK